MITFKQQFTFQESSVKNFALFLGWEEKLTRQVEKEVEVGDITETIIEDEEYDNPQTFIEYVEEKAKEHSQKFTKAYAESLYQAQLNSQIEELKDSVEPALKEQIIKPVEDALTSEVIID